MAGARAAAESATTTTTTAVTTGCCWARWRWRPASRVNILHVGDSELGGQSVGTSEEKNVTHTDSPGTRQQACNLCANGRVYDATNATLTEHPRICAPAITTHTIQRRPISSVAVTSGICRAIYLTSMYFQYNPSSAIGGWRDKNCVVSELRLTFICILIPLMEIRNNKECKAFFMGVIRIPNESKI